MPEQPEIATVATMLLGAAGIYLIVLGAVVYGTALVRQCEDAATE